MKNFNIKFIVYIALMAVISACETDHVSELEEFERGGTVKATVDPEHSFIDLFGDINSTTIEFDLKPYDANGTNGELIDRLEISLQYIPSSGMPSAEVPVSTETDLNKRVVYKATDLISLIPGLTVDDLSAGDVLRLIFTVVMKDGREFGPNNTASQICAAAGSNGTCNLDITVICPLEADFTGIYAMDDPSGVWGGTVEVTNAGGTVRTVTGTMFGFSGISFDINLVCGEVLLIEKSVGLACGGGAAPIITSTPPVPSTYDPTDDSSLAVTILYPNNCGYSAGTIITYTLSK